MSRNLPTVSNLFGFTQEERIGRGAGELVTPESFARIEKQYKATKKKRDDAIDPKRIVTLELEYYRKDGSTVWMETMIGSVRDKDGRLTGFHGVTRDISQRRLSEEKRKDSEERYRLLLERANDMIIVHEVSLKGPGPSLRQMIGYPDGCLTQNPFQGFGEIASLKYKSLSSQPDLINLPSGYGVVENSNQSPDPPPRQSPASQENKNVYFKPAVTSETKGILI